LVSVGTIQTEKSAIKGAPFALSLPGPREEASATGEGNSHPEGTSLSYRVKKREGGYFKH
jgi:hypothetical protein